MVVTAGFSTGNLGSIFPPGIPIGHITQATVEAQQASQRVHLAPFADLRDMDAGGLGPVDCKRPPAACADRLRERL